MKLLSIFNNGSGAWIILVFMIILTAFKTYAVVAGSKKGYHKQLPDGSYQNLPTNFKAIVTNPNFIFGLVGDILLLGFLLWINSEYK